MNSKLFVGLCFVLSACATHRGIDRRTASETGVTSESDEELARRFAPAVLSELSDNEMRAKFDHVDAIFYDVAQTSTHVFLSYQVMKGYSENVSLGPVFAPKTKHWIDSEDVFLVLVKAADQLRPVMLDLNAHGFRTRHFLNLVGGDRARVATYAKENQRLLAPLRVGSSAQLKDQLKDQPPIFPFASVAVVPLSAAVGEETRFESLGDHPLVISVGGSHALFAGEVSKIQDLAKDSRKWNFALPAGETLSKLSWKVSAYPLVWIRDALKEQTFSEETRKQEPQKTLLCLERALPGVNAAYHVPAMPTHFDVESYLRRYQPDLLATVQERKDGTLNVLEADVFYANGREGKETTRDCVRMDPVEYFRRVLPATFAEQNASAAYTRYRLLE